MTLIVGIGGAVAVASAVRERGVLVGAGGGRHAAADRATEPRGVHGDVGLPQQVCGIERVVREQAHADVGTDLDDVVVGDGEGLVRGREEPVR